MRIYKLELLGWMENLCQYAGMFSFSYFQPIAMQGYLGGDIVQEKAFVPSIAASQPLPVTAATPASSLLLFGPISSVSFFLYPSRPPGLDPKNVHNKV